MNARYIIVLGLLAVLLIPVLVSAFEEIGMKPCPYDCMKKPCKEYIDCYFLKGYQCKEKEAYCCKGECKPIEDVDDKLEDILKKTQDIYERSSSMQYSLDVLGTEYIAGEPAKLWLQLLENFQPLPNATCYITAYYPDNTIFLNSVIMNPLNEGIHYYDLTAPNTVGVYMCYAHCYTPRQGFVDDFLDFSKLEDWENVTITDGKISLTEVLLELPDYKEVDATANMTGNMLLVHLNEQSGTIVDTSGEGNDGSYNGALYSQAGKFDTAIGFDGSNDRINIGFVQGLNFTGKDFTIALWTKTNTAKYSGLITNSLWVTWNNLGGWAIQELNNGKVRAILGANGTGASIKVDSTTNIADNQWHYIVAVYDRDNMLSVYIDGAYENSLSISSKENGEVNMPSPEPVRIGVTAYYGEEHYNGIIDELAVWNRTLTSDEVSNLYNRSFNIGVTSGFIQSNPNNLTEEQWLKFGSDYSVEQGSISFSVLDETNNTICGLGDISSCANTTSPIKLYAELTRATPYLDSPEIDRWWLTWSLDEVQELRGAGEMHISKFDQKEIWKYFYFNPLTGVFMMKTGANYTWLIILIFIVLILIIGGAWWKGSH